MSRSPRLRLQSLIQAAAVTLLAASAAHAQQAVQWKVTDGGNGHWYQVVEQGSACWESARVEAQSRGGHLATLTSVQEDAWLRNRLPDLPWYFLGGRQDPDACEPACGWYWITGETWNPLWDSSQPDGDLPWTVPQDILTTYRRGWHDGPDCGTQSDCGGSCPFGGFILEWSSDCNADGIVDYGQCRDGTLPDYNANNVPDCCESGTPCVTSSYPLQWRDVDAGNGHWYEVILTRASFSNQQSAALARGGMVVCVVGADENSFVFRIARAHALPSVWIGMVQDAAGSEPDGGWRWVDGSTSSWRYWGVGEPNNWQAEEDNCVMIVTPAPYDEPYWPSRWQDYADFAQISSIVEWSADCNNDGIVDYGQILQSQLPDANSNGIPDQCECASNPALPACCPGNLNGDSVVDGADLGILLFAWGPAAGAPAADLNADGQVNGADLGVLLSTWGACP